MPVTLVLIGRSEFEVAGWVERLVVDGEFANERMMVGLGSRGAAFHTVFGPPGPKLHRPDGQLADMIVRPAASTH